MFSLGLSPMPSELSIQVNPKASYDPWQTYRYRIELPPNSKGKSLCTGWIYPVKQWHREQWPYRDSCRIVGNERIVQETWGGPKYPLPFIGEYRAHAYLFDPSTQTGDTVWATFTLNGASP